MTLWLPHNYSQIAHVRPECCEAFCVAKVQIPRQGFCVATSLHGLLPSCVDAQTYLGLLPNTGMTNFTSLQPSIHVRLMSHLIGGVVVPPTLSGMCLLTITMTKGPRPKVPLGTCLLCQNRMLMDILRWGDMDMERVHNYVQWIFPTDEARPGLMSQGASDVQLFDWSSCFATEQNCRVFLIV